jgi:hypothetical protein
MVVEEMKKHIPRLKMEKGRRKKAFDLNKLPPNDEEGF